MLPIARSMIDTSQRRQTASRMATTAVVLLVTVLALGTTTAFAGLRGQMLALTNQSRRAHGTHAVRMDHRVSHKVKHHSRKMARSEELFHTANVPRYLRGRNYNWWGENVGYSYQSDLGSLQRAFMNSPLHRRNILNGAYDRVGIGVERHDDRVWVTLVFYG
jgi:uncharacterized protein YkwD